MKYKTEKLPVLGDYAGFRVIVWDKLGFQFSVTEKISGTQMTIVQNNKTFLNEDEVLKSLKYCVINQAKKIYQESSYIPGQEFTFWFIR